mmetsp:Transcript_10458/g.19572  ORF Transcript_10458/g.19572 Transcript_10458/m.19572 type:complete len:287 (+) Transcript_10458:212-1072(+)
MVGSLGLAVVAVCVSAWAVTASSPKVFSYKVLRTMEHDTHAFTEGLMFRESDGAMLESTGLNHQSYVSTYKVSEQGDKLKLKDKIAFPSGFGEGITMYRDWLVALTWKMKRVHLFDKHTVKFIKTVDYDPGIYEGWGLTQTSDRKHILSSDGSPMLHKIGLKADGRGFEIQGHIHVHDCANDFPQVLGINELELVPRSVSHKETLRDTWHVRGSGPGREEHLKKDVNISSDLVWGNIISTMCIAMIDPTSGNVEGWLLLDGIYDGWTKYDKVANVSMLFRFFNIKA